MTDVETRSRSAGVVALGTLLMSIFGALTQVAIAARFGASSELDAFYAALVVPNTLVTILLGSLSSVFLPIFVEQRTKSGERKAWHLTETLVGSFGFFLLVVSALTFAGAEPLLQLITPGLAPVTRALAARVLRILLPMLLLGGLASIAASMLNAYHRFTISTAANVGRSLVYLLTLWLLTLAWSVSGLAVAMVLSYATALLVMLVALRPWLFAFRPRLDLSSPTYRRLVSLWLVLLLSTFISRLYPVLDRYYASQLSAGSISYLTYVTSINGFVLSLFSASMAKVVFPTMAEDIATGNPQGAIQSMAQTIRLSAFILMPAIIGLLTLREPVIALLLERGAFDATDTTITAQALLFSAGLLFGPVITNVTSKMLYALKATRFIFWLNALRIPIYIGLCELLVGPLGILGIALAGSIMVTLGWPMQLVYLRRQLGPLGLGRLFVALGSALGRALVMGLAVHYIFDLLDGLLPGLRPVTLLGGVAVGMMVYGMLSLLLVPSETRLFADRFGRAIRLVG